MMVLLGLSLHPKQKPIQFRPLLIVFLTEITLAVLQNSTNDSNEPLHIDLPYPENTDTLGENLALWLQAGDVVLLQGDLGAGKSALSRACIQALPNSDGTASDEEVPSPTFTLVQTYERLVGTVWHFDLYRLGDAEELYELGWEEARQNGICLIEWPDRLGYLCPTAYLEIHLNHVGDGRTATLTPHGLSIERINNLKQVLHG